MRIHRPYAAPSDSSPQIDLDTAAVLTSLALDGPAPYLLRRLQPIVVAIYAEAMKEFDLTAPQYAALSAVVALPGLDQNTTAFMAGVERTTIVGVINRLAQKGLLKRVRSATDKRVRLLQPTLAGIKFIKRVQPSIESIGPRLLAPMPVEQREEFCKALRLLLHGRLFEEARQLSTNRADLLRSPRSPRARRRR